MKNMKKRSVLYIVIGIIAVISIIGAGFAAWTFISNVDENLTGGQFTADELQDKRFTLTAAFDTGVEGTGSALVFGGPAADATVAQPTDQWFAHEGEIIDNLEVKFTVTITPNGTLGENDAAYYLGDRNILVELGCGDYDAYNKAVKDEENSDANYITYPELKCGETTSEELEDEWSDNNKISIELTAADFEADDGKLVATVTITVYWGSFTESKNPTVYYNELDTNNTEKDVCKHTYEACSDGASTMLDVVSELNDVTYSIHFSTVATSTTTE